MIPSDYPRFNLSTSLLVGFLLASLPCSPGRADQNSRVFPVGVDPICSHDVVISNCTIDDGDDNISVKTDAVVDPDATPNSTADASGILITGCTFLHGHGLSLGSVTAGGIHDVVAGNCTFQGTQNGLRIKSGRDRGGTVQNILYYNIRM